MQVILRYTLARSTRFKITCWHLYHVICKFSQLYVVRGVFLKWNYILAFFYWKVYVDDVSSRIYNLNIQYIALRVEINLAILSKVQSFHKLECLQVD